MGDIIYPAPSIERETMRGTETVSLITNAFSERKIFLLGTVDEIMLNSFTLQLIYLSKDETQPIDIIINSPGGIVPYGLAIYDQIQGCQCQINMYCIGMAASMAAIIFAGGQKNRRFILPHSEVMIHEPLLSSVGGSASSIKTTAESIIQTRDILNGILAKHTGKTVKEIDQATNHDNKMSAQEAIDFGLCDKIVERVS